MLIAALWMLWLLRGRVELLLPLLLPPGVLGGLAVPAVRCLARAGPLLGVCTLPGLRGMSLGLGLLGRRRLWAGRSRSLAVTSGLGSQRSSAAAKVLAKVRLLAVGGVPTRVDALLARDLGSGLRAICLLGPVLGLLLRGGTVTMRGVHG